MRERESKRVSVHSKRIPFSDDGNVVGTNGDLMRSGVPLHKKDLVGFNKMQWLRTPLVSSCNVYPLTFIKSNLSSNIRRVCSWLKRVLRNITSPSMDNGRDEARAKSSPEIPIVVRGGPEARG